jgi:hypothetical protein
MENNTQGIGRQDDLSTQTEENFMAGIVGAFLFSLVGVIVWFVIYQLDYIAGVAGIVTIICALKGYTVFGKVLSLKGLIISLLISAAMIYIAEYVCIGYDIYVAFKQEYNITIFDALRAVEDFLQEESVRRGFITDLALGYTLTLLGSVRNIISVFSSIRKQRNA